MNHIDWKGYFAHKAKNLFKTSNIFNINLGFFISFFVAVVSAIEAIRLDIWALWIGVPIGFSGLVFCAMYIDANSGHWKGEERKEVKKEAIQNYITKLEEENKSLKDQLSRSENVPQTG